MLYPVELWQRKVFIADASVATQPDCRSVVLSIVDRLFLSNILCVRRMVVPRTCCVMTHIGMYHLSYTQCARGVSNKHFIS